MLQNISIIAVLLILVATTIEFVLNQWRWISIAWVFQVFSVFWLTTLSWSFAESAVKLIGGWIAIAIVSSVHPDSILEKENETMTSGFGFRFLVIAMIWLLAFSSSSLIQNLIPARVEILWGGMLLLGSGIIQVGFSRNIIRTIIGLITFISGFEVMYASIESSVLVSGVLAFLTIGLAWLTVYFHSTEEELRVE
ncbi:hypothetical protein [Leptolinea tardivitalis]|uniref:Uncharacterized protein n=1 Tax=Leptolinea tardivitalis TaxID=229920 RepID=A0A0P6X4E0_9CHLR|nr:hypothetical protein [Leptolinea tardivitalis]KPL74756.1 hypothetical protein ADM99_01380 [Leptolinea tardivitalis]GAP22872.1 hypothetical protein LTAR_03114 [Leptolinea tardivitalis]